MKSESHFSRGKLERTFREESLRKRKAHARCYFEEGAAACSKESHLLKDKAGKNTPRNKKMKKGEKMNLFQRGKVEMFVEKKAIRFEGENV